ncbi:response regulator transcription factor [Bordetella bronchiseptica]|uniref:response regulator transcription factor n=1 Tax=Bordetella bronchiseptica TaxID=518 RepID=UPI00045A266A|nr:response regulator transcription factor [Bordetella bronchiseptica]KCV56176.1 putative transcriptional regulatory protein QseB [Bordetella bronchiseptica 7E71]
MTHLLLVEDDPMLGDALQTALQRELGARVDWVRDGAQAQLALVDHAYQLILLDIGLPGQSGLALLRALREGYDTTPVLLVTARDQLSDRIRGLDGGADDYIVKPFELDELLARLRAVLRRSHNQVAPLMRHGELLVDPAARQVSRAGRPVALSQSEYRTLLALMQRRGRTVSREQLEHDVYGTSVALESNTVAVYVHQLRRKLGDDLIETVHGYGYRIGQEGA